MASLFRCDQCGYEETRTADEEPWQCPVCGWMRWEAVEGEDPSGNNPSGNDPSGGGAAGPGHDGPGEGDP